jgi:hypothetical protein
MKKILALCLLSIMALSTLAVEDGQVMYVSGTVGALTDGVLGRLDTTSETALTFEYSRSKLVIPFATIDSYEYSQRAARHLGVLPAIAVGLVKHRQRKHFLRIAYHDESQAPQVAIFEVPKQMPRTLLTILQVRAPQGCKAQAFAKCGQPN